MIWFSPKSGHFFSFLTEKPAVSREVFENNGILVTDVNNFIENIQKVGFFFLAVEYLGLPDKNGKNQQYGKGVHLVTEIKLRDFHMSDMHTDLSNYFKGLFETILDNWLIKTV